MSSAITLKELIEKYRFYFDSQTELVVDEAERAASMGKGFSSNIKFKVFENNTAFWVSCQIDVLQGARGAESVRVSLDKQKIDFTKPAGEAPREKSIISEKPQIVSPKIAMPKISMPKISLPKIALPKFNIPSRTAPRFLPKKTVEPEPKKQEIKREFKMPQIRIDFNSVRTVATLIGVALLMIFVLNYVVASIGAKPTIQKHEYLLSSDRQFYNFSDTIRITANVVGYGGNCTIYVSGPDGAFQDNGTKLCSNLSSIEFSPVDLRGTSGLYTVLVFSDDFTDYTQFYRGVEPK